MARRAKRSDGYLRKTFTIEGKKYYIYGKNAQELFEKEKAKREKIERGVEKKGNPTVSQYCESWVEGRRKTVSEATIRTQDKFFGVIKNIPVKTVEGVDSSKVFFGDLKIKKVDKHHLEELQNSLKEGRKTQTVNDYMAMLKHMFSRAVKEGVIPSNPCSLIDPLKRTEERARDTHHRALSVEETKAFFECDRCKKSYYYNVFRFAINTGMRVGEIGALRYSDIRNDLIHVERTITRTETGAYKIGDNAKTEAGRRIIPMNEQIKAIVADQKEINRLLDGNVVSMNEPIFKAVERGLLMPTPIDREIKRICQAAGISHFTMHAFRATFATRAIESGVNPKTLQEILGHSNFNITMSLYGHCLTDTKKQAMESVIIAI